MATRKKGEATKEKILAAAKEEILEKGIEGCTMESIAKRAGITRLMLYYHFENKSKIITEFMLNILNTAKPFMQEGVANILKLKNASSEMFLSTIKKVLNPNIDIMRVFLSEAMKSHSENEEVEKAIFTFLGELFSHLIDSIEKIGKKIKDKEDFFARVFFFQSVPLIFFMAFSDEMIKHFGFDEDRVKAIFGKKFFETLRATIKSVK
jgi:AcrR family transcriptional regulator